MYKDEISSIFTNSLTIAEIWNVATEGLNLQCMWHHTGAKYLQVLALCFYYFSTYQHSGHFYHPIMNIFIEYLS